MVTILYVEEEADVELFAREIKRVGFLQSGLNKNEREGQLVICRANRTRTRERDTDNMQS